MRLIEPGCPKPGKRAGVPPPVGLKWMLRVCFLHASHSQRAFPNTWRSTHLTFIGIRNAEAVYTDDWLGRGLSVIVSNDHILTVIHAAG